MSGTSRRWGHFSEDGLEYVITRPQTPRPWYNRFGNAEYALVLSQMGGGYSTAGVARRYQLTWYVPRYDEAGRYLYLRDEDGQFWNASNGPTRNTLDRFECRHGLGWTTYLSARGGIACEMTVFVPRSGPVELWRLVFRNESRKARRIAVFPFVEWSMDMEPQSVDDLVYAAASDASFEPATGAIVASRRDAEHFRYHRAFMMMDARPDSWDGNRAAFVGEGRRLVNPAAVEKGRCSGTPAEAEISVGAFSRKLRLEPGSYAALHVMVGLAQTRVERSRLRRRFLADGAPARELAAVRDFWERTAERFAIRTPDSDFDRYVNRWLVKHVLTQGSTPAVRSLNIGFRNYVQDVLGLMHLDPEGSARLLRTASRYFYASGDTAMSWSMGKGGAAGKPSHVDTKVWFVLAVCAYIRETGDVGILRFRSPFVDASGDSTVMEKVRLVLDKCWTDRGQHGLSLIGGGDWNDNLSGMGKGGKGVSVWMSEAVCLALKETEALLAWTGDRRGASMLRRRAVQLAAAIQKGGRDGDRYIMGYRDDGEPVGSIRDRDPRFFLLPQAWAVIAGVVSPGSRDKVLRLADRKLGSEYGPLLMDRPYDRPDPSVGRITMLQRGMSENGPAYSHASTFKTFADGIAGRGDALYRDLVRLLPFRHDPAKTLGEPFVVANFYRPKAIPRKHGATHRSWVTSTPNWALRSVAEGMMGVRMGYDSVEFDPSIPRKWKRCSIRRIIRGHACDISIENPDGIEHGVRTVFVDGARIEGNRVPYFKDGESHRIRVVMGRAKERRSSGSRNKRHPGIRS